MAKSDELPDFRRKRKILFGTRVSPQEMLETGRKFMQAGRFDDALELFQRAQAAPEVQKIAKLAIEKGDTALLLRAKVVLKEEPTEKELTTIARNAETTGRKSMAVLAYEKAGHKEQAERLRDEIGLAPPSADAVPQGKEEP